MTLELWDFGAAAEHLQEKGCYILVLIQRLCVRRIVRRAFSQVRKEGMLPTVPCCVVLAVLWCTMPCCAALYCTVLCCTVLWCTMPCCAALYCTVLCRAVVCCAVVYCAGVCCGVL
jgi:hypothetical protein